MENVCQTCIGQLEIAFNFKLKCDKLNYEPSQDTATMRALCEICGETFQNAESLESHRGACPKGKSTDQQKSQAEEHETSKKKSEIRRKPLKLRISAKNGVFLQTKYTEKVEKASKDVEPNRNEFVCPYCKFKFLNSGGLHSHMMWHKIRKTKYKCKECKLTFLNDLDLRKHFKYDH